MANKNLLTYLLCGLVGISNNLIVVSGFKYAPYKYREVRLDIHLLIIIIIIIIVMSILESAPKCRRLEEEEVEEVEEVEGYMEKLPDELLLRILMALFTTTGKLHHRGG